MANLKEQDIVLMTKDAEGNTIIQMPITRKENVEGLVEILEKAIPTGFVLPFAANSTPDGFLLCNGAAVSRTTYADLFAKIGTTYGTGNGSTTFNLPNLTDKFIQGSGTAGTVKNAGLPNITGKTYPVKSTDTVSNSGALYTETGGVTNLQGYGDTKNYWKTIHIDASKSNSIYGNSTTVQPPALTMRYYIKY